MSVSKIEARISLLSTRIAADTKALAEAQAQLSAAALVNDVAAGFVVTFKVGRADTRREVEGVVLGRGEVKGVDSVRVQSGEGFELEVHTVKVAELLSIKAPGGAAVAAVAEPGVEVPGNEVDDVLNGLVG